MDYDENTAGSDGAPVRPGETAGVVARGVDTSEDLLPTLYQELRQMAAAKMAREQPQTLQATALVHEAWLKLGEQKFENRAHFFGAAAEAMRRILVERARRRSRLKRGGELERADYQESQIICPVDDDRLLQVNEALEELAALDPIKAKIVKLRFFAGLENGEIAALLGVNEKTVRRHWQVAKVMLFQLIKGASDSTPPCATG